MYLNSMWPYNLSDNIKKSLYDERDVERIQNVDAYLRLFLDNGKAGGDVEKAQVILHDSLVWRKAYDIRGKVPGKLE